MHCSNTRSYSSFVTFKFGSSDLRSIFLESPVFSGSSAHRSLHTENRSHTFSFAGHQPVSPISFTNRTSEQFSLPNNSHFARTEHQIDAAHTNWKTKLTCLHDLHNSVRSRRSAPPSDYLRRFRRFDSNRSKMSSPSLPALLTCQVKGSPKFGFVSIVRRIRGVSAKCPGVRMGLSRPTG